MYDLRIILCICSRNELSPDSLLSNFLKIGPSLGSRLNTSSKIYKKVWQLRRILKRRTEILKPLMKDFPLFEIILSFDNSAAYKE